MCLQFPKTACQLWIDLTIEPFSSLQFQHLVILGIIPSITPEFFGAILTLDTISVLLRLVFENVNITFTCNYEVLTILFCFFNYYYYHI